MKHHNHHEEHHKHAAQPAKQPSKFSLFKHRVAGLFKEAVEAPPEEHIEPEKEVETVEHGIRITAETSDAPVKEIEERKEEVVEEVDEEDLRRQEREEMREKIHEHIVSNLNNAVSKWKETGDIGVHLEPPVPLKDKVKSFLSKVREKSSPMALKLKNQIEEVAEKVAARLKRAEHSGETVDADVVVKDEWDRVLKKMEAMGGASEREEIEKIYKQLAGE